MYSKCIDHPFLWSERAGLCQEATIWVVVSHLSLTFGMIPIIDYWGYWPTPTDGSRIDVRSHGIHGADQL